MREAFRCRLLFALGALIFPILLLGCQPEAPEPAEPTEENGTADAGDDASGDIDMAFSMEPNPCPDPPPCGDDCSNQPYEPTDCWTTEYGPARADIVLGNPLTSSSMLYCEGGSPYALCYFSGPSTPTGKNPENPALPCIVDGDTANCTCQVYTSGPYYVAITSILNEGAYYETIQTCGTDGSLCKSLASCGPDGDGTCDEKLTPPVCQYVNQQNPNDDAVSLIPGADLISTFSFAMKDDYTYGTTACEGLYAGCMTAPCTWGETDGTDPQDGDPVQCECPLWEGTYQIGQPKQEDNCPVLQPPGNGYRYVWSAANAVLGASAE